MCSRTQWLRTPVYYDLLWLCRLPGLSLVVLLSLCHVAIWGSVVIWRLTGHSAAHSQSGKVMLIAFWEFWWAVEQSAFMGFLQLLELFQAWQLGFKRKCFKHLKTSVSWETVITKPWKSQIGPCSEFYRLGESQMGTPDSRREKVARARLPRDMAYWSTNLEISYHKTLQKVRFLLWIWPEEK